MWKQKYLITDATNIRFSQVFRATQKFSEHNIATDAFLLNFVYFFTKLCVSDKVTSADALLRYHVKGEIQNFQLGNCISCKKFAVQILWLLELLSLISSTAPSLEVEVCQLSFSNLSQLTMRKGRELLYHSFRIFLYK